MPPKPNSAKPPYPAKPGAKQPFPPQPVAAAKGKPPVVPLKESMARRLAKK